MSKLDLICANLNKQAGGNILTKGIIYEDLPRIPFSSYRLNYMTHGGFPRGYMAEFYGDGGGGKTTTSLDILANAQKLFQKEWEEKIAELEEIKNPNKLQKQEYAALKESGPKKCIFLDIECTLDKEWATTLGVDINNLYVLTPENQSAETILQMALDLCDSGEVGLVILDSIGSLYSDQEAEKSLAEKTYCGVAGALTRFSKKMIRLSKQYGISVIMINQVREDMDAQYGTRLKTTGGKAFKHHCVLRMMFMKGEYLDERNGKLTSGCESPAGNIVKVHIEKSKKFPLDRKEGFYTLSYTKGVDKIADLIDVCILRGVIVRSGAFYSILDTDGTVLEDDEGTELKFQGKANLQEFIENTEPIYNYLIECLK